MVTKRQTSQPVGPYLDEIKAMIQARHPDAEFTLVRERPDEITVDVVADFEEEWDGPDEVAERTTDILVETGLHIVVVRRQRSGSD